MTHSLTIEDVPAINLQPGELILARTPSIVHTILGSCVSVSFWSPRLVAGALCHGVLPRCPKDAGRDISQRYVDYSIRYLAAQFDAMGVRRQDIEIKVFGGADVLPIRAGNSKATVGALNCQAALEVLEEEGFHVLASDLGGIRGRTIRFHTGTGEVFLNRHGRVVFSPDRNRA